MKNNIIIKSWIILLSFLVISCSNEEIDTKNVKNKNENRIEINQTYSDFTGFTLASDGTPISGVAVKSRGEILTYSNANGYFELEPEIRNYVSVLNFEHNNFISVTKVLDEYTKLIISMKKRGETNIINSRRGAKISFMAGGMISIPPNAFSFRDRPYDGNVAIRVTYLDVTNDNDLQSAPGSYIAIDDQYNLVPLTSFGMLEVTAVIPEENIELQLQEGVAIDVALPILTENIPNAVNLYEFSDSLGYWILKDQLRTSDGTLLGQITSVNRTWNADKPCSQNLVCVKIKVVFTNGDPGCGVAAKGLSYLGYDGVKTPDSNGYVSFNVCPDSVFKLLSPVAPCPGPYFSTIIDLSTVTMNPSGCTNLGTWTINN